MNELVLGDLVSLTRGTTYQSALLGLPGPVLLGLASIKRNGGFRDDNLKTYGGESPEKLTLRPGDIYVSLKDVTQAAELLGAIARVPTHIPAGRVTQDTVKLTFIREDISSRYVYWLLRTPVYREYCRAHAIGTTNLALPREDFLSFPIPRPGNQEMSLVELLDALDDKIELNRRMNATLEAMARALFQSWFVDFDPVRAKQAGQGFNSPRRKGEAKGFESPDLHLFPDSFQDSELGPIPKGWEISKLKNLTSKIGSGATPRGGSEVYVEEGIALIRSQNVYDHEFHWSGLARLTDKSADELRNVEVMKNDVLLNITGDSILRTCVVDQSVLPARVNQHVAIIRAIRGIPPRYLHLYLVQPAIKTLLIGMSAGATRHAITKGHLESVDVLHPPSDVLEAFEKIVTPWFDQIDLNRIQSRTLATLRDTLLPKLLSGELSVAGFEKEVSI